MNEFDSMNFMNLEERTLRPDEVSNLDYQTLRNRVNKIYNNALLRLQMQEITIIERSALQEVALKAKDSLLKNNQGALVSFYNTDYKKLLNIGTQSDFALVEDFEYVIPQTEEVLMPDDADITDFVLEVSPNLEVVSEVKKEPEAVTQSFIQKHKGKLIAGGILAGLALFGGGED